MLKIKKWFSKFVEYEKIDLKYRRISDEENGVHVDVYINDIFSHTVNVLARRI